METMDSVLPASVTDIQFELDGICELFDVDPTQHIESETNLLVVASKFGTRIIGHPSSRFLQILYFKDRTNMPRSTFELHGTPRVLSLNCEENLLAVNYNANGLSFIGIFSVNSFMSPEDLHLLTKLPFDYLARQIVWNPVVNRTFAICLDDGSLTICFFKANTHLVLKKIEQDRARCMCWNQEGNEVVVALLNGELWQYKLERGLIETIKSPYNLFDGPFAPIALEWLSTNQFAVVFLENSTHARPKLYIVNALVSEHPTFIRLDDTCYSVRTSPVYLMHLPQWNLILTGSKNEDQINVLTADRAKGTPSWMQLNFADETRTTLPLAIESHGSFPMLGFALENQKQQFAKETLLISTILACGRLVTIKLMITKNVPTVANANRCIHPLSEVAIENLAPTEVAIQNQAGKIMPNVSEVVEMESEQIEIKTENMEMDADIRAQNSSPNTSIQSDPEFRSFVCDICEKQFIQKCTMRNHIHNIHMKNRFDYKYNGTGARAPPEIDLLSSPTDAVSRAHGKIRAQKPTSYSSHQSGSESVPFKCNICEKSFVRKSEGRKHIHEIYLKNRFEYKSTETGTTTPPEIDPLSLPSDTDPHDHGKKRSPEFKTVQTQKNSDSHPHICHICGERYKHIGRLIHHQESDHAKNVSVKISMPAKQLTNLENQVPKNKYTCKCTFTTNHSGNFHRHRRICKQSDYQQKK